MIEVSSTFQSLFDAGEDRYSHRMQLTLADGTVLTEDQFGAERFKTAPVYEDDCSNSESFDIGSAVIGSVSFQLMNTDGFFDDYDLDGAQLILWECPDGAEDIQKGVYYITDAPEDYSATLSIEAQDRMYLLERYIFQNKTSISDWSSVTALQVVNDILQRNGMTQLSEMPNGTMEVPHVDLGEATDRTVLFYITQITGTAARVSNMGILTVRQYDSSADPIEVSRVHDGTIAKSIITVTGVSVTDSSGGTTFSSGTDGYMLSLEDNPFVVDSTITDILAVVAAAYVGLTFTRMSVSCHASPAWEPMDRITVDDIRGNAHTGYITNISYTTNGQSTVAQAAATPEKQSVNRYTEATKIVETARAITSTAVSSYDEQVQQLTSLISTGSGLYKIEEVQEDGSVVYYLADKPTVEASTVVWKYTSEGLVVSKDGGTSWAVDSNGNALFSVITAHGINADWINVGTLQGVEVIADTGSIGAWEITDEKLVGTFSAKIPPDQDDMDTLNAYLDGSGTLTDEQKTYFDFDGDGDIDARDKLNLRRYLLGIIDNPYTGSNITDIPTATVTVTLNPSNIDNTLRMSAYSVYKSANVVSRHGLLSSSVRKFSSTIRTEGNIVLDANGKSLYGTDSNGNEFVLASIASSGNILIGSDSNDFDGIMNVYSGYASTSHTPQINFMVGNGVEQDGDAVKDGFTMYASINTSGQVIGSVLRPRFAYSTGPAHVHYLGTSSYRWKTIYSVDDLNTSSDKRLKEHVAYIDDDFDKIVEFYKDLKPVEYRRNGESNIEVGLYAQEVLDCLEKHDVAGTRIVEEGDDGYLSLYYGSIHSITIGVVQHLIKRIEELEKRIAEIGE